MRIMVFDTETTDINKCFCYNIGYVIADTETNKTLVERDYIVEQIWHNIPLFSTAYYADKRPIYVNRMRARSVKMNKFGLICQQMIRDIKQYEVEIAFAFNSPFDDKVFTFNCDYFKCINPFDDVPIYDIRGYAHQFLTDTEYIKFCEDNELFTDSGNYSTTAEAYTRYITQNIDFVEEHTALSDSRIELMILLECLNRGADINGNYLPKRSIAREVKETWTIKVDRSEVMSISAKSVTVRKANHTITFK